MKNPDTRSLQAIEGNIGCYNAATLTRPNKNFRRILSAGSFSFGISLSLNKLKVAMQNINPSNLNTYNVSAVAYCFILMPRL